MDSCGGHDVPIESEGIEIVFLPYKTTAIRQPLDLSLIALSRIRYRAALFAAVLEIMENRSTANHSYASKSGNGGYGIREGQLLHVADAMEIFNKAWSETRCSTIIKCCIKSQCLGGLKCKI